MKLKIKVCHGLSFYLCYISMSQTEWKGLYYCTLFVDVVSVDGFSLDDEGKKERDREREERQRGWKDG